MRLQRAVLLFCLICFAVPLAVYGLTGTSARHRADDFCHSGDIFAEGFWNAQVVVYLNSSDRYSVEPLVGISEMLGAQSIRWLPGLAILLWVAGAAWSIAQGWQALRGGGAPKLASLLAGAALVFFTLLAAPSRFQSLYWRAGLLTYLVPLVAQTWLAGYLLRQARRGQAGAPALAGAGLIAFLAGGFSETTAALQAGALVLALLGAAVLLRFFGPRSALAKGLISRSFSTPEPAASAPPWRVEGRCPELAEGETFRACLAKMLAAALMGTLLAMLVLYLSPAAHLRKANFAPSPDVLTIILTSLRFGWDFMVDSVKVVPLPLAVALAVGFLLRLSLSAESAETSKGSASGETLKVIRIFRVGIMKMFVTLMAAYLLLVCCVAPSVYVYQAGMEPRAAIAARLVTVLAAGGLGWLAAQALCQMSAGLRLSPPRLQLAALLVLALFSLYPLRSALQAAGELPDYQRRAAAWDARDAQIRADKERGLQEIITLELDSIDKIGDLKADPDEWVNVCAARYYGVRTIKAVND